ncbi:MAG: Flp family type IVb pilin [Firmicutes bacterium]|nr:Flp family type IVb pilin [Bacillota bacterium]
MELINRLFREEEGQSMTEYVLIVALIALAAVVAMKFYGKSINNVFNKTGNTMSGNS